MKVKKKLVGLLVGVLCLSTMVSFTGCSSSSEEESTAGSGDLANTLIYAGENEDSINPILNDGGELEGIIFSGLMKYDQVGSPVEDLAESYTFDEGSLTYTFKLKEGIKWHDGEAFSAQDVVFTYNELTTDTTLSASTLSNYEDIASVTAVDDNTVNITLSDYNAAMLDNFTIGIIPKHLLEGQDLTTAVFNQTPVGTGRYKFLEWDKTGGSITLEKNENYYGKVPNIDRVVYKTVAVESTKALMLESGEADLAWLNANYAEEFRGNEAYTNYDFTTADYRAVSVDNRTDFWINNKDSVGVLNYAIDKEAVVKSVLNNQGCTAYSTIQLNAYGGNEEADIYSYDLDKFAQEMEALGWVKGGDGIYERNGEKFHFTIQVRDYEEERIDIANVVSSQLKEVGVDMEIVLVTKFDWDAGYNGFLSGYAVEFDPDALYAQFTTDGSSNTMKYSNPTVDELLTKARHEKDQATRKDLYGQFEVAFSEQPGSVLIAYLDGNYVSISGLEGLDTGRVLGHHAVGVMWNIEDWTLNK